MERIYMDNAATTRLSERALAVMLPCFRENFGNPSAIHEEGQRAKKTLEDCRARMAAALGALRSEIYFTSGGTEGDNWVIRSAAAQRQERGRGRHIVSSCIEHNAVRRTLEQLEQEGWEVTWLTPERDGQIPPAKLEAAIREDTVLVSIMLANNVVGTVLDIAALSAVARAHRVLFHTDAVQAVGHIPVRVRELGVDFLTLSAHKFGGPKGVGAVYCRLPNRLAALLTGGGQERETRSGTENLPGIVGMTEALEQSVEALGQSVPYLTRLGARLTEGVLRIPGTILTGDAVRRLPGFASFVVEGIPHGVYLVGELDRLGISVSSGSACSAASREASHVLQALGYGPLAGNGLRITLCADNTQEEVDRLIELLPDCISRVRAKKSTGVF